MGRLGVSGVPEAVSAALILVYLEAFPQNSPSDRSWQSFAFDLIACFAAGVVGRWPRVGTAGVAVALGGMALTHPETVSMGVFTLFIPIVSNGAHGREMLRDLSAVGYTVLACLNTVPRAREVGEVIETVVLWMLLVGIAWAAGRTVNTLRRETQQQKQLREDALRRQRRGIARDLHDTVSYATSTMIMRAEQIKLRSPDPELNADLDFIISTGRRSIRDLRGMMEALRRNDPGLGESEEDSAWRLVTIGDVITERVTELAAHGIPLQVSVTDDIDSLPGSVREALGKLIVEATSNMVKHAAKGPCRMIIDVDDGVVEAVFTNPVRDGTIPVIGEGLRLGLIGAAERVEAIGGELETTQASGTWILRAQLPIGE